VFLLNSRFLQFYVTDNWIASLASS